MKSLCRAISVILALTAFLLSTHAYSWGNDGHEIVGDIADRLLVGTNAEARVREILGNTETLRHASTWPDRAKGGSHREMKKFRAANPGHHGYHYTDVPFQEADYVFDAVGTTDHDIIVTLRQCIAALQGAKKAPLNPHGFDEKQALRLLAHLVGDLHQPLHVGSAYIDDGDFIVPVDEAQASASATNGGNYLLLGWGRNLHGDWDTNAVDGARRLFKAKSFAAFSLALVPDSAKPLRGVDGNVASWPVEWAEESLVAAKPAYDSLVIGNPKKSGGKTTWRVKKSPGYDDASASAANTQLALGGRRLAGMLIAIWP